MQSTGVPLATATASPPRPNTTTTTAPSNKRRKASTKPATTTTDIPSAIARLTETAPTTTTTADTSSATDGDVDYWVCRTCTLFNVAGAVYCDACGDPRTAAPTIAVA